MTTTRSILLVTITLLAICPFPSLDGVAAKPTVGVSFVNCHAASAPDAGQYEILEEDEDDYTDESFGADAYSIFNTDRETDFWAPRPQSGEVVTLKCGRVRRAFDLADYLYDGGDYIDGTEGAKFNRLTDYQARAKTMDKIRRMGYGGERAFRFMFRGLADDVEIFLQKYADAAPVDARIIFRPDAEIKFGIVPEHAGLSADRDALYRQMHEKFLQSPRFEVAVQTAPVQAEITAQTLTACTNRRCSFSTSIASSAPARKHNVARALSKFNGMRVEPGQTVSFNAVVGLRTAANGFMEAKIILNGKFEDGVGGGVCQSSTTLYNAALLADMKIEAANPHSLSVGYVPPSFDAMVNATWSDLKFINTSELPVFIRAHADQNRATVEFYGTKLPYRIARRSEVVKTTPHPGWETLLDLAGKYRESAPYKGEFHVETSPKDGLQSRGYLQYYKGNKLIKETRIRSDAYAPLKGVRYEGIWDRPTEEQIYLSPAPNDIRNGVILPAHPQTAS